MKDSLQYKEFEIEDYLQIEARPESNVVKLGFDREKEGDFILNHPQSRAMTITYEDRPVAIIGLFQMYDNVAEAWVLCSEEIKKFGKEFSLKCLWCLHHYSKELGFHTVVGRVREDFELAQSWTERMGFVPTDKTVDNPDGTKSILYLWRCE